jgi:hypothetical protein
MDKKRNADLSLMRLRSSSAAISDGYRLYMNNFRRVFRSSWIAALVYALAMGVFVNIVITRLPMAAVVQATGQMGNPALQPMLVTTGLFLLGGSILLLAALTVLLSYGFSALGEQLATGSVTAPAKWYGRIDRLALWRTLKAALWLLVVAMKFLGRLAGLMLIGGTLLLLLAALLPLAYTIMKYVLTPKSAFLAILKDTYAVGLRHWGGLFIVVLVVSIVNMLLDVVTQMPANILYAANVNSQMGALQGDPLGMPAYMGWMNIVVFTAAGFVQAYVQLSALFPLAYMYGSIETQENERSQAKRRLSKYDDEEKNSVS